MQIKKLAILLQNYKIQTFISGQTTVLQPREALIPVWQNRTV